MDHQLRSALRRVEPSSGFAERVIGRIAAAGRGLPATTRRRALTRWAGLGLAASLAAAFAAGWMQSAARQGEAERARQDVELALRITTEKLQIVQSAVQSKVQARVASILSRL